MMSNSPTFIALRNTQGRKAILAVIAIITFGLAVPIVLGGQEALSLVAQLSTSHILALLVTIIAAWNLYLLKLRALLNQKTINLGYWRMVRIYMATEFVSRVTPAGAGAPITAVTLLEPHGLKPSTTLAIFGVAAYMDAVVLALCIGGFAYTGLIEEAYTNTAASIVAVTTVLTIIVMGTYLIRRRHKFLARLFDSLLRILRIRKKTRRGAQRLVISLHRALEKIARLPTWRLVLSWLACFLYWATYLSTLYLSIVLLGGDITWLEAGFIQAVAMGVGHILMAPGGMGGTEISSALLLTPVLGPALAGSAILIWRFFVFHLYLLAGGLSLLTLARPCASERLSHR